jgi:Holliday junction resolvase RusA-like endonuclease
MEARELTFIVPGRAVSVNRTWRGKAGQSKPYRSRETNEERERIGTIIRAAIAESGKPWEPLKWFGSIIVFWNALADEDNLRKGLWDSMQGIAIQNDRYSIDSHVMKRWDGDGPRTEVTIFAVDPLEYGRKKDRNPRPRAADAGKRMVVFMGDGRPASLPPGLARFLNRPRKVPKMPP